MSENAKTASGRVAVITGASRGIGAAIAETLRDAGYRVASFDISDAAPHTDFFIYNIPQLAGVALSIPLIKQMQQNPRVVGVKNSSMPVYDIEGFRRAFDRECILFNGPDEQFVAGRAIGADGASRSRSSRTSTTPCCRPTRTGSC